MSKIIIYDNKNILIANLDRTESKKERKDFDVAGYKNPAQFIILNMQQFLQNIN